MEATTVNFPSAHLGQKWPKKIDLMAFYWCPGSETECSESPRSTLAIMVLLGTEQAAVAAAAAAATFHLTCRNILNSSDGGCPINPNIVSY